MGDMLCGEQMKKLLIPGLIVTSWLAPVSVHSTLSSSNYSITSSIIASGGGTSSSVSYNMHSVFGLSTIAGTTTSASYSLHAGFLSIPDSDGDGLTDSQEAALGTNPNEPDSDFDGINDYDEVNRDGNTNDYTPGVDTNPNDNDTDDDWVKDGVELNNGTDPLDPVDYPGNGDVNGDTEINAGDIVVCLNLMMNAGYDMRCDAAPLDANGAPTLDMNIDVSDIMVIQQRALGLR
jgi:hypothetical protein